MNIQKRIIRESMICLGKMMGSMSLGFVFGCVPLSFDWCLRCVAIGDGACVYKAIV